VTNELFTEWADLWLPEETLPLSQWAEKHFYLSPEYSARTGQINLYGWQREPLDAFTDPRVETIVLMCGVQMLKTLLQQIALAYVIAEAPGPVLFSQYKDTDVKKFSKERLAPMLRDIPALRDKVAGGKRDAENTIEYKQFPGGSITLVGSLSPANFAGRSIRYYFGDEIDKYPASVGKEGDPIDLAYERTTTYLSRKKIILACSPTIRGVSRIAKAYEASDRRKPWVPCPNCGEYQVLRWSKDTVRWDNSLRTIDDRAASARYHCERCEYGWNDVQRKAACEKSEWRNERPFTGTAGFWISHLYSPWKNLSGIVRQFLLAKGNRERMMVWTNTTLAELWDEPGDTPDWEKVYARREAYPFGVENAVVPMRGLFLTAAVDVQEDHLWVEVCAWGRGKERWSIAYEQIKVMGPDNQPLRTTDRRVWEELEKILMRDWPHESGETLPITVMTIDTGNRPRPVYEFARRHAQPAYGSAGLRIYAVRTVVPVKGSSSREMQQIIMGVTKEDAARKRGGVRIVTVGTSAAKQEIYDALRVRPGKEPMPGAYRFPSYEQFVFEQLCSEKKISHANGTVEWQKLGANHFLDCAVYNRAGAAMFGVDRNANNEAWWAKLESLISPPKEAAAATPTPPPPQRQHIDPGSDWLGGRGRNWF
jgi:phage terminase large subunit GpA-like protein